MELIFSKADSANALESIKELYLAAFPAHERRTFHGLIAQVERSTNCSVNAVNTIDGVVGFYTFWDFEAFGFVEHIAIEPRFRGMKLGERTLQHIAAECQKPIVLEVEPPTDEDSRRRIQFYIRNGFQLVDIPYFQPSYTNIGENTDMMLMTNSIHLSHNQLIEAAEQIHQVVYGHKDAAE